MRTRIYLFEEDVSDEVFNESLKKLPTKDLSGDTNNKLNKTYCHIEDLHGRCAYIFFDIETEFDFKPQPLNLVDKSVCPKDWCWGDCSEYKISSVKLCRDSQGKDYIQVSISEY